jgi:transposase
LSRRSLTDGCDDSIPPAVRVWIATGRTDKRRSMNSLALLVQEAFRRDPHGSDLYVFRGKAASWSKSFAGSDEGGRRAAAIYTLVATAKLNDIDPQAWLADVLARLPDHSAKRIHKLLPWEWRLHNIAHARCLSAGNNLTRVFAGCVRRARAAADNSRPPKPRPLVRRCLWRSIIIPFVMVGLLKIKQDWMAGLPTWT